MKPNVTPCLWFDGNAEEAVNFYVGLIANSTITGITRYPESAAKASGNKAGAVMTVAFELNGQPFLALNGGPNFKFTPAVSFMLYCDTQDEVDALWDGLGEGGKHMNCGWLTDRYGMSWQIVPSIVHEVMTSGDADKTERLTAAVLTMNKLEVAVLEKACNAPGATGPQRKEKP